MLNPLNGLSRSRVVTREISGHDFSPAIYAEIPAHPVFDHLFYPAKVPYLKN